MILPDVRDAFSASAIQRASVAMTSDMRTFGQVDLVLPGEQAVDEAIELFHADLPEIPQVRGGRLHRQPRQRKGWLRFWCRARSFQSPWTSKPISVSASAMLSNSGSSPPHSPSTTRNGDAPNIGVAMLPRKRVRTAWNGTGQAWRSSSARTIFVSGALPLPAAMGRHDTVRDRSPQTRSTVRACKACRDTSAWGVISPSAGTDPYRSSCAAKPSRVAAGFAFKVQNLRKPDSSVRPDPRPPPRYSPPTLSSPARLLSTYRYRNATVNRAVRFRSVLPVGRFSTYEVTGPD